MKDRAEYEEDLATRRRILIPSAVLVFVVQVTLSLASIWTGDKRWAETAGVLLAVQLGFALFVFNWRDA